MSKKKLLNQNLKSFRIAIYTRVSTEEQAVNPEGSIKNQEERIREFIKLKNMVEPFGEVAAIFSDPGRSAKDMNRPGFQKMLTSIRNQEINMVIVTELSRFSRSTKDFAILQEFLDEHNCKFLSLRENFDTSGAAGSMVMNLMATIAEFERRQTAERISNSFLARSKRGLYNGGSVPLGYRIDKDRPGYLVIDSEESEFVRIAFKEFLKHETLAKTAKYLTSIGIVPPQKVHGSGSKREKHFTVDSLYRLLRNKAYIGIRIFQSKNGPEEVRAVWEPIIDNETFERTNLLLSKNCYHKRTHGENRFPYTLSGLIFCSQCNESMSGKSAHGRGGKVGYYEHIKAGRMQSGSPIKLPIHNPHRVPAVKLEPQVWKEVKRFIQSDSFAKELLEQAKALRTNEDGTNERDLIQKKITATENQIELLAERISTLPKELDLRPIIDQLTKLQKSKEDFEANLKNLPKAKPTIDSPIDVSDLTTFRKTLRKMIDRANTDLSLQSSLIKKLVHKIIIKPEGFEIHFHIGESYYNAGNPAKQSQISGFFKDQGSSLLTNGDPSAQTSKPAQPLGITKICISEKPDYSKEIVEKYLSGSSASDIAKLYSCSKQKILSILKKNKINMRPARTVTTRTAVLQLKSKSGAKPFYGFCYFEGKLSKHPIEFPVLLKIHRLWLEGKSIHQINQELDKQKVKSREGKKWSWAAIRNIVERFENKFLILQKGGKYELR